MFLMLQITVVDAGTCPVPPRRPGSSCERARDKDLRPGLSAGERCARRALGAWHRERQGGRTGRHGHNGHDLHVACLHQLNRKTQKEEERFGPPNQLSRACAVFFVIWRLTSLCPV